MVGSAQSVIFSFFGESTHPSYLRLQRRVVDRFRPKGTPFLQIAAGVSHGQSIDLFVGSTAWSNYLLLDIDCIPLRDDAIQTALAAAASGKLYGCAQRANHLANGAHLYAGPCALAFSRELWLGAGSPSFVETARGDTAEELTYACEARGIPVEKLWPTAVEQPLWDLSEGRRFGIGTTFADQFYHVFFSRDGAPSASFRARCEAICPELARFTEFDPPFREFVRRKLRNRLVHPASRLIKMLHDRVSK